MTPSLAQVTADVLDATLDLIATAYTDITVEAGAAVDQARTEVHGNARIRVQLTVCRVGDYPQLSGEVNADIAGRCTAAHPEDRTPCVGPLDAVTVLDAHNAGTTGCEHHAARLLASLKGGRVYSGSVPEAAIRVFKAAADLPPFAWTRDTRPAAPAMPGIIRTAHGDCAACRKPFDPSDTRWNGQGRHQNTEFCRACIDRCHDNDSADHRCRVCTNTF